ncbi:YgdI/YgdR family lipoprotein [Endozoicomonas sp. SM1973]|uniref:YgdI/YgdR family lipoprotein n=1 Tax=Spartinivicinus marinus TaxID=2994442 RepID=A0A853I3A2_9GAMM|nr:YgdI/YgdR family lipoprotein [Spartinivicinus marinus]MCX4025251.1 YgdI/YgdR family lipoprotein [Spartinivicinus marinus]NYZ65972.1 YgdI/YgdR family lipoprotein [Spartinivicinus marinus]
MSKWFLVISAFVLLTGCSTPHRIVLIDGSEIETLDQPEYNKATGFYEYEGASGKDRAINKDQVKSISEL